MKLIYIEYANNLVKRLKSKYNINDNFIIDVELGNIQDGLLGVYYPNEYTEKCKYTSIIININIDFNAINLAKTVYHEFRHAWQFYYYRDLYCYCLNPSRAKWYFEKYYDEENCLECDALLFGETFGMKNRQDLLDNHKLF